MTTPTGTIKMSDVRLEIYGSATGQIDMKDPNVYILAGKTNGSQISMSDLKGKSWVTFTPDGGTVSDNETYPNNADITISCNKTATWTYSLTSGQSADFISLSSGGSGLSIEFRLNSQQFGGILTSVYSLTGVSNGVTKHFTINLTANSLS